MTTNHAYPKDNAQLLREERSRVLVALGRMLLLPVPEGAAEHVLFMSSDPIGDPLNDITLQLAVGYARERACDVVCRTFAPGKAVLRPNSVNLVLMRDGQVFVIRSNDVWVDRDAKTMAIVPRNGTGYMVSDGVQLLQRSGRPARNLTPSVARAHKLINSRAGAVEDEVARSCIDPLATMTA